MSLFKRDTQQNISAYDFAWKGQGCIEVTDRAGKKETYSVNALSRLCNSQGMSTDMRNMACAALDWAQDNLPKRSSREFKTTPGL
jgi:hypothetical protein